MSSYVLVETKNKGKRSKTLSHYSHSCLFTSNSNLSTKYNGGKSYILNNITNSEC